MDADIPLAYGATIALLTLRIGAALRLVPFFGGAPMPLPAWAGLSVSLAALLAPQAGPATLTLTGAVLAALACKEIFIGVIIGAMVRFAFTVLEVVGEIAGIASLVVHKDQETTVYSRFTILLGTGVFLLVDGHHALLQGIAATTRCIPPHSFPTASGFGFAEEGVIALFSGAMATGVVVAGPLFAAGIAADLVLGAVSRIYPGVAEAGAQTARVLATQLAVVASLLFVVSSAVGFLQTSLQNLELCTR